MFLKISASGNVEQKIIASDVESEYQLTVGYDADSKTYAIIVEDRLILAVGSILAYASKSLHSLIEYEEGGIKVRFSTANGRIEATDFGIQFFIKDEVNIPKTKSIRDIVKVRI